jgi:transposase
MAFGKVVKGREVVDRVLEQTRITVTSVSRWITAIATMAALQCFRGLQVHGAMVLATELVDWRRFASPRQLMAYLGFVPREHTSGPRERRGSITKAGNTHGRHVLVHAAWAYRLRRGSQIAVVAAAPALVGYQWAVMRDLAPLAPPAEAPGA